jgi:formate dehydrogenase subunit gamma
MTPVDHAQAATPLDLALIRGIAEELKPLDGALLPILHAINDRFGYVDERAVFVVAEVLNLSRAEVHGVVTFYHDFRRAPPGRHVVKLCRAEACQSVGADKLFADVEAACGDDGKVTVEPVFCLGNCALGPAALIDGNLHGRIDCAAVRDLVRT